MVSYQKIVFTKHAAIQAHYRGISKQQVIDCIHYPDQVVRQSGNRYRCVQVVLEKQRRYLLVVIYDVIVKQSLVITTFITSKFKKYL